MKRCLRGGAVTGSAETVNVALTTTPKLQNNPIEDWVTKISLFVLDVTSIKYMENSLGLTFSSYQITGLRQYKGKYQKFSKKSVQRSLCKYK